RLAQHADKLLLTFQEEDRHAENMSEVTCLLAGEETGSVLSCSARDIAEELTRLDSALFVRVVPFHCLGCVWSQRDKKENRSLAPSVRATISQFNSVTNWVINSLLCTPTTPNPTHNALPSPRLHPCCHDTSPAHRAHIIEKWITVALALFVRVVPFHCLGCVWSQRDKKENRSLAPSVRATISQFNSVTNWVINSLLCTPTTPNPTHNALPSPRLHPCCHDTSPAHRAHIIEKWITVALECHQLRNFSSLRAILSALQSNAVYRLKKTWATVSKESLATFDRLCESFPDENCLLANREILEVCVCARTEPTE
ncbi:ral guanine nucleotide dissociation stimulator-like 1, partial [Tachysurus ichikawai]